MGLPSQLRKQLTEALLDAFPDKASLEQMLSFELDISVDTIAGGNNLQDKVFELIKKAEAGNWVTKLVDAARRQNPGNQLLKEVAAEIKELNLTSHQDSQLPMPVVLYYTVPEVPQANQTAPPNPLLEIPVTGEKASEIGADYTRLRDLLAAKRFGRADLTTLSIILWITNRQEGEILNKKDIEKIPKTDLCTINKLWVVGSNGKFGFSVQK